MKLKQDCKKKKAMKDMRNNIMVLGLKKQTISQNDKQTEDIKEKRKILNEFCEVELNDCDVAKLICMGKYTESKKRFSLLSCPPFSYRDLICVHLVKYVYMKTKMVEFRKTSVVSGARQNLSFSETHRIGNNGKNENKTSSTKMLSQ